MAILSCAVCDGEFQAHGRSKYCSPACRASGTAKAKADYMKRWHAEYAAKNGRTQGSDWRREFRGIDPRAEVLCFSCNEPLVNVRSNQSRYPLHKVCRQTAPEWMRKGRDKPESTKVTALRAAQAKAAAGTSGGGRVWTAGDCSWCAESFVGLSHYCSTRCRTAAKFARRSSGQSFNIPPRDRLKIYERDAWICQLCDHPVDSNLRHPHIWSATLDHIVPQSQMLIPDHSPSNLRLAHMWCNSARGDGSNMTETEFLERVAAHFDGALAA